RFHFVNDDRSLWTDLFNVVPPPSYKIPDNEIVEYTNSEGEEVIAKISDIKGSPWSISIERSKEAALTTATRFLEIISAFGVVLLIAGIFLAWVMSRNITEPLNKFSDAASDISAGDYSHLVDIKQKDELGALARSFNTMVVKVRDSQLELESKIKNRTAELRKANENLEELNEKLKELDKLKTNFFTNVSHELRTPLALIMGPVEKLLSQKDLSKNEEKDLRIIQQNARILLKQVNNLLDLSKLEVGKMELEYSDLDLANLVRVIASYFEAMAIEKKITLKVSLPDTLPVQADADKIERVLINLLSNAFKFTPENGRIECGLSLDNSAVTFFVKDSGPGVKPEFQKEIFVKYKKADKGLIRHLGSTGLGLSIVKEFIELHKGSIRVKNNEKAGATFSFKIPLNAPAGTILHGRMIINETEIKDEVESYEILRRDNNNKKLIYNLKPSEKLLPIKGLPTILVIEDNHDMNSFICQTLSSSFNVISAYDGEDGYAKAVKNKPDLIITDIMMPRLSGDMVVSKIKANPDM
ncbi:MAG: HAMP domain-containing protein, partial [Ignavibacteriales bacterium]